MEITLGYDVDTRRTVVFDTQKLLNGHLQLSGVSGMGKTYRLTKLLTDLVKVASEKRQSLRLHVFNPHGDIVLPDSSVVLFSQAAQYGYNPLEINPDPIDGGVNRVVDDFLGALNKQKTVGSKQESVMRYLLEELFNSRGFYANDSRSWIPDDPRMIHEKLKGKEGRMYLDVAFEHKQRFKDLLVASGYRGGYDTEFKCWYLERKEHYDDDFLMWEPRNLFKIPPTIDDLVRFTERKLKAKFLGTNSAAMSLLTDVNRSANTYNRKITEYMKRGEVLGAAESEKCKLDLDKSKEKCLSALKSYLEAIQSGRELDDVIRYQSLDVLNSVYERFQNLRSIGIYNHTAPPFNPNKSVWMYNIKPLADSTQSMLVDLVCTKIFERCARRGEQNDVVEIIVIDEGKRYVSDDDKHILSRIARESRKYGLALWIISQSPSHFPDDFISATGTTIIVGLASADAPVAARKLGIEPALLENITPQKTAVVQMKLRGVLTTPFQLITLT